MPPEMSNAEAIEMMNRCKSEIMNLRGTIERLQPKADAYDNLVTILRLLPQPSRGYGEDMVWILNNRIKELTPKPADHPITPM